MENIWRYRKMDIEKIQNEIEKIEKIQNEIEKEIKQALDLLLSADNKMCDLINNGIDENHDISRKNAYLYNCISLLKNEILDI